MAGNAREKRVLPVDNNVIQFPGKCLNSRTTISQDVEKKQSFKLNDVLRTGKGTDAHSTISFRTAKLGFDNKTNFGLESKLLTSFIITRW